ncbi:MAG: DUF554 domain-containing protein [Spirochaetaceae bacterium]|jgi:uncharacterized membrane protein YqgA involved in biofilm formation|nr:DUF554 domain-containing protein [Spirochaetaceae bacterium]
MLGPFVNAGVIVVCSLIGVLLVKNIPARFEEILKKAIGLAIVYVGLKGAFDNNHALLLIMSLVIGALLGELVDIDRGMNRLGAWAEKSLVRFQKPGNTATGGETRGKSFAKGFVSASILFCSGAMAIVGSMQSGLEGNHETLFAKSILDGSISIVFSASLGIGVLFSAIPVLVYQGGIALLAIAARNMLTPDIITEMSAVGNLLVAAIGFNFLAVGGTEGKEIKVANLIPAVFVPLVYLSVRGLFG